MSDNEEQMQQELERLDERSEQFFQECRIRSALRVAKEATRLAKSHRDAIHYMRGLFDQMRFGHGLLDPKLVREASVQLILMLKDEEQARKIQPDLDEGHYHWVCSWMSSCAYDNLAEATGTMSGYNSDGMHECINEGIQACRETGKLECIGCFREYASDVYMASEDLEMVRHQCGTLMEFREDQDSKDRRWSAQRKLASVHLLQGRLTAAAEALNKAMELSRAEKVYLKTHAALLVGVAWDEVLILLGQGRFNWDELYRRGIEVPESGEWPRFEFERARADALALVVDGRCQEGISLLTEWDRRLTEQQCLNEWFEVRLRLIAAYLLDGQRARAESLAKGLEAKAHEAQDHLTLARLHRLLAAETVCPVPMLEDPDAGPFATGMSSGLEPAASRPAADEPAAVEASPRADDDKPATPLAGMLAEAMQRMMEIQEDDEKRSELLQEFLEMTPDQVESSHDAAYLVHLSQFLVRGPDDAIRVWPWAQDFIRKFPDDGTLLSVVAAMGAYFRSADGETFEDVISPDQLEKWFRLSLSLHGKHARNYSRAAAFFQDQGNLGEAERCLARAFRLDRQDGSIAQQLAEIYSRTDRPRDALAVLDLCLREGTKDETVAWEAAMTSLQLERYDSLLTYLDHFRELADEIPLWLHYYRAVAWLHLQRPTQALEEIDREAAQEGLPGTFHLDFIRACALCDLGRREAAEELLERLLGIPPRTVDYLSFNGLLRLSSQLLTRIQTWPAENRLRQEFELRLLECGLLPDEYFDTLREPRETVADLHFYRVRLRQSLDARWGDSMACLPGQQEWPDYDIDWGVLAFDEEEAVRAVQAFQTRSYPAPCEVIELDESEDQYTDKPGVVWQGYRRCETMDDEFEEPDFFDEDDHDHDHDDD